MSVALGREHPVKNRRGNRRVRQEARDALAVVAFSATASTLLALAITLVVTLAG